MEDDLLVNEYDKEKREKNVFSFLKFSYGLAGIRPQINIVPT